MKKFITLIGIYEIVIILILSSEDVCNSILCIFSGHRHCDFCEYSGFQYLVMCLLIPSIIALIWWWKDEIKNKIIQIEQKNQDNKKRIYNHILDEELQNSKSKTIFNQNAERFMFLLDNIMNQLGEDANITKKIKNYMITLYDLNNILKEDIAIDKKSVIDMLDSALQAIINNQNSSPMDVVKAEHIKQKLKKLQ